jgi:hypothetical protein
MLMVLFRGPSIATRGRKILERTGGRLACELAFSAQGRWAVSSERSSRGQDHDVVFSYARSEQKLMRLAREVQGNARAGTPGEAAWCVGRWPLAVRPGMWERPHPCRAMVGAT